jgi:hypothetical protein
VAEQTFHRLRIVLLEFIRKVARLCCGLWKPKQVIPHRELSNLPETLSFFLSLTCRVVTASGVYCPRGGRMAPTNNGLTDIGQGKGFTTNFQVQYESSLSNQAIIIANANALLAAIENEFTVTTGWFNTPSGKFGTGNRQVVNLNLAATSTSFPGANNNGYGNPINLDAQNFTGDPATAGRVEMVFMNEWVEILMSLSSGKWNAADSSGEGLSQYSGIVRFQAGHYNYYRSWVNQWLNQQPRQDWVNTTKGTDKDAISFGCALAFIYYLNVQLSFSINQIIAAGASNLATAYRTLTGDAGDPFPFFAGLLERVYPSSATASIPGPVTDDPFPIGQLSFWANKDTFGKDEVQDVINTSGGLWPKAFWLVVEGFSKNSFNALGVTIPAPTGPFANLTASRSRRIRTSISRTQPPPRPRRESAFPSTSLSPTRPWPQISRAREARLTSSTHFSPSQGPRYRVPMLRPSSRCWPVPIPTSRTSIRTAAILPRTTSST